MTGLLALIGVVVGYLIAGHQRARRDAKLMRILRPSIANTAAPTTAELGDRRETTETTEWHQRTDECSPSDIDPVWCNTHARYITADRAPRTGDRP